MTDASSNPAAAPGAPAPTVAACVVTYESAVSIVPCLEALLAQRRPADELLVIDNASSDGSADLVAERFPQVRLVRNRENVGLCAALNAALRETSADLFLTLNPDVFLDPAFLAQAVQPFADPGVGAVQGKVLATTLAEGTCPTIRTIDTTGLVLRRSRRNFERGQGEPDRGQYDAPGEVFGADACAGLYRRAMFDDVAVAGEVFDEAFFAYREIVDLHWRACVHGWRTAYEPSAVAYHLRRFSPATRSQVPRRLRRMSLRNRYLLVAKNDTIKAVARDLPWIVAFEAGALAYLVAREPRLLAGYWDALRALPAAWRRRRLFRSGRPVDDAAAGRWLGAGGRF